jgi:DNA-binding transcriptional LysR family regulator
MAPEQNLRGMDLNLLTIFEVIFEAGSITRGAERLGPTQPTASHALARLRDTFRDDLFVRSGHGVTPTPTARQLYPRVKQALDALRRAMADARGFDPADSTRRAVIAIPHPMGPVWALAIREAVLAAAPNMRLEFDTRTLPIDMAGRLRNGEVDVAVDWFPADGDRYVRRRLFDDRLVFVTRGFHPRITANSDLAALRQEKFVGIHARQGHPPESMQAVRQAIEELDVEWVISLSEFLEVPFVALQTDFVCYLPESMLKRNAGEVLLHVISNVIPDIPIPISLVWHESRRLDEAHRWLRDLVAATVVQQVSG